MSHACHAGGQGTEELRPGSGLGSKPQPLRDHWPGRSLCPAWVQRTRKVWAAPCGWGRPAGGPTTARPCVSTAPGGSPEGVRRPGGPARRPPGHAGRQPGLAGEGPLPGGLGRPRAEALLAGTAVPGAGPGEPCPRPTACPFPARPSFGTGFPRAPGRAPAACGGRPRWSGALGLPRGTRQANLSFLACAPARQPLPTSPCPPTASTHWL